MNATGNGGITLVLISAVGWLLGGCQAVSSEASGSVPLDVRPVNYSSHGPEFFREFLSGRVYVSHLPEYTGDQILSNRVRAAYYHPDGAVFTCWYYDATYMARRSKWRVIFSRVRTLFNLFNPLTGPDPEKRKGHAPLFYDPPTGRLHGEGWDRRAQSRYVGTVGWVQESWPRALKDQCPELGLPAELSINEKQTSLFMSELREQDPDASIRDFLGSHDRRTVGGTGIEYARSQGTVPFPATDLKRFLVENDGHVLESFKGRRYVLALNPERDELWRFKDDGTIEDIGYLTPSADGKVITLSYEKLPYKVYFLVGYALPLVWTGERYDAMAMMDWLVAQERDVALPFLEREGVAFRFAAGGAVKARATTGDDVAGRWWWSRGRLHVRLDGVARANAYPWRDLAAHVGWTAGQ